MVGEQISVEQLQAYISAGLPADSLILDVRTPEEFSKGAISGAVNIPVDELADKIESLSGYKKIYINCLSGGRSQMAIAMLSAAGLTAELYNVTSGILAWRAAGYPLV